MGVEVMVNSGRKFYFAINPSLSHSLSLPLSHDGCRVSSVLAICAVCTTIMLIFYY